MTIQEFYDALHTRIPPSLSCPWDNDGIAVCPDLGARVTGVVVALDLTHTVLQKALESGSNVILTHHPLLFHGVKAVVADPLDPTPQKIITLIQKGITAMAFHTRLDTLTGGVNDTLADLLGLENVIPFGDNDNPAGEAMGRMGTLPTPMSMQDFAQLVKARLQTGSVTVVDNGRPIQRVALLGGSGGDELYTAYAQGADVLVTGEAKHHQLCHAMDMGMGLVVAGHDRTEHPVCSVLALMASEICTQMGEILPVTMVSNTQIQTI